MVEPEPTNANSACRFCKQPIPIDASKCHHCGEQLAQRSPIEKLTRRIMGFIGVITAVLSLFYGLREGYFLIMERQQQRAMASAYLAAAENFIKLDSLSYAEDSMGRALAINPNDQTLRARVFFLRAGHLLREADYYGAQLPLEKFDAIPEMIINGFSLLNNKLPAPERATLMLSLARLLQYDRRWQASEGITELFEKAHRLAPNDAGVTYWYGDWLVNEETSAEQGIALIGQAATMDAKSALYANALGRVQARQGDYHAAFDSFRRAIDSSPEQHDLQNIRAANEAAGNLARALSDANKISPISGDEFLGMTLDERVGITRFALEQANNRQLRFLAAQLFHHAGLDNEAEVQIRKYIGTYNTRSREEELELLASILGAQGNSSEQAAVLDILARKAELATYDDILETGLVDQHRYKVGLRLSKEELAEGVLVLKAYEQYPFHKAGVRPGDILLEFSHRTVSNMLSMTRLIYDFTPGTDVPLKLRRGEDVLELTLVIE